MNVNYISIKDIAGELYSHPLMRDLSYEKIIRDTIELIQITGCPNLFEEKIANLKIENHKTLLPCDYYKITQLCLSSNSSKDKLGKAFVSSTDTYTPKGESLTYKIQGSILQTSIKEGEAVLSYIAIKLDDEGFPMIANDAAFIRALKSYIKMNWFTVLFESSQIRADILENAQREYYANIATAQNSLMMPSINEMEVISRILNTSVIKSNEHSRHFKNLSNINILKVH